MKINVVARDEKSAERFLSRHEEFRSEIEIILGAVSLFAVLDELIRSGDDIEIFCHDDVFLPRSFLRSTSEWLDSANFDWPNWGIAGNAGISAYQIGLGAHEVVRFLSDPHGGPTGIRQTVPCQSIDGNLILLNCARLRESGFELPPFGGFHLYDLVTSIETLRCGLSVLATPALSCYHDSKGSLAGFNQAINSHSFQSYLSNQVQNREILTVNGLVKIDRASRTEPAPDACDLPTAAIHNASKGRVQPSLSIITRSTFGRDGFLERCCLSVDIAQAFSNSEIAQTIVTGNHLAPEVFFGRPVVKLETTKADNRFELVAEAAKWATTDYVLFIDDDDWIFPNRVELLLKLLAVVGNGAPVFVQAAHFSESPRTTIDKVEFPPSLLKRVFEPEELINSFSGHNYIPFSGCLFPTKVLRDLPKDLVERITFYEDFATMLFAISACESPPAFFPSLISGISIRSDESQSVTVGDRDLWNQSMAELDSIFFDSARAGLIADIVNASTFKKTDARLTRDENIVQHLLSQRDDAIEHLEVLAKSWTWRFTRPLRALSFVKRKLSDRKDSIDLQR